MARWAEVCTQWVDADRIVAAMPFHWIDLWTPGTEGSRALGGKNLPRARAAWERLGEAVVQKERAAAQQQLKLKLKEKQ